MQIGKQDYPYTNFKGYGVNAVKSIDYSHHEIHAGSHFSACVYDSDVDTATPKIIRITTPNTAKWAHLIVNYTSTGAGLWQFFENPTLNAAGTSVTAFNNDRNSTTAATVTIFQDTTVTSNGTELWCDHTGSDGIGGSKASSASGRDGELILKQNEDYILIFTPDANDAKLIANLSWYEHTNV